MLQQIIKQSLASLLGQTSKEQPKPVFDPRKTTHEAKRITSQDLDVLTTQEIQKRALYEWLAEHQRRVDAEEQAGKTNSSGS